MTKLGWPAIATDASIPTRGRGGRGSSGSSGAAEVAGTGDSPLSLGSADPLFPTSVSGDCPGSGTATGTGGSAPLRRRSAKIHRGCGGSRRKSQALGTTRAASLGCASERVAGLPRGPCEIKTLGVLGGATPGFFHRPFCSFLQGRTRKGEWEGKGERERER